LCNWIPEGVRDSAGTDTNFGRNVLFLPVLEVKLNDLKVNRLQGLQGNVIGRGHGTVLLSVAQ